MSEKTEDIYLSEGLRILEEAKAQGVTLRIMGAIAIRLHCDKYRQLHVDMGREISDIDFVGYNKESRKIERFFEELGYIIRPLSYSQRQAGRLIFLDKTHDRHVDVFLDKLAMCHTIKYKNRLEVDYPTVPLAEILLQKMQIVKLSEKDVKDTIILFLEHEVGNSDDDMINIEYIAKILADDWGFYYTVTTNLAKIKKLLPNFEILTDENRNVVINRIDTTLARFEEEPKTRSWKLRAKIGPRKKWYRDVYSAPA